MAPSYLEVSGSSGEDEDAEEGKSDAVTSRLPPAVVALGAAMLILSLLIIAAIAGKGTDRPGHGVLPRRGATVLRRAEEAGQTTSLSLPSCNALPVFHRYANAGTIGDVRCICPTGQIKTLCSKGSRSQNACCKEAVGDRGAMPASKDADCAPPPGNCTLLVSFGPLATLEDMEALTQEYEEQAESSILTGVKVVTMHFGGKTEDCCKAYSEIQASDPSLKVDFDGEVRTATGGSLGIGGFGAPVVGGVGSPVAGGIQAPAPLVLPTLPPAEADAPPAYGGSL